MLLSLQAENSKHWPWEKHELSVSHLSVCLPVFGLPSLPESFLGAEAEECTLFSHSGGAHVLLRLEKTSLNLSELVDPVQSAHCTEEETEVKTSTGSQNPDITCHH